MVTGTIRLVHGSVPNDGLITNLPRECSVEVPVFVDRQGLRPQVVGDLPPACAAINRLSINQVQLTVEAALTGNPRLVFQAIAHDPLTAAMLSLAEIKEMVNEMFQQNRDYLPQFKHLDV